MLLGSTNLADYRVVEGFTEGLGTQVGAAFLVAIDADHVGIEGPGTVDGQGAELAKNQAKAGDKDWGKRPFLIRLLRCKGVNLRNLKEAHSGAWTTYLSRCQDVVISGAEIKSFGLAHNDGIDVDSCRNVQITDSVIHSGDDSICFKTLGPVPCQDIVVSHCRLESGEGAIKFGTESVGNFSNIDVSDCTVLGAKEGGIKLFSVDGSRMQNISISNIAMTHVNLPIMVRLGARLHTFHPEDHPEPIGTIKDVRIIHVDAKQCSNVGILISGVPGNRIENLSMRDIHLELAGGGTKAEAATVLEEREKDYPEVKMFGKSMPVYGVYARHVRELKIDDLTIKVLQPDVRPASYSDDVLDRSFTHWNFPAP